MTKPMRFVALVVLVASMGTLAGCSSKITDEQLAQLRTLRQQEATLQQQIRTKRDEKSRAQSEINRLRADLDQCGKDRSFVQANLAKWPNVWPDWEYQEPSGGVGSTPRR